MASPAGDQANVQGSGSKVTLYWLEKSRSQRVLWLLEEVKANYEIQTFKRINMLAPPEFQKLHPIGKAPVISVESSATKKGEPLVLAESGTIIEYLIDHFGPRLAPKRYADETTHGQVGTETESWLRYRYFMHYVEGSLMPLLVTMLLMNVIQSGSPFFLKPVTGLITGAVKTKYLGPNLKTHFEFLEKQISTSPDNGRYMCGPELSGADILLSFPLGAARGRAGLTKELYPNLWAYVARLEELDSFKRAVQKIIEIDGEYDGNL